MIKRAPGLRIVVSTMIESIPDVASVLLVCVLLFLICAIFTVGYLKDALALVIFATAFVLVTVRTLPRWALQGMFLAGFSYDAVFTLHPHWHCAPLDTAEGQRIVVLLLGFTAAVVAATGVYCLATPP